MQIDFHSDDPKLIWQNQPREESEVNLVLIRQKARNLQAKTRRQFAGALTVPLVVVFFYLLSIKRFFNLSYGLHSLFAFALAWSIAGLFLLNRERRPGALPADAGFSTGLEFCRRELESRCKYFQGDLLWSFGPIVLAIGTYVATLAAVVGPANPLPRGPSAIPCRRVDSCISNDQNSSTAAVAAGDRGAKRNRTGK